jgi:hypothetical protein
MDAFLAALPAIISATKDIVELGVQAFTVQRVTALVGE